MERSSVQRIECLKPVYVDNDLLAVVKPAGLLSQGDSTGDLSILDWAKAWVKKKSNKPGNV
jgi:23S rRNA pseudouridine1911/1915/1917 synthase